ncbi:MAG: hypothetical protein KIT31_05235 [Deltaproteobacteria bacterium]|nr:hypothetical protein [Deltaproteobacteria bacterium]
MSNAAPLVLGVGGGLALWQLLRPTTATSNASSARQPTSPAASADAASAEVLHRNDQIPTCLVRIGATGVVVDGAHVEIGEAVRRARLATRTQLAVDQDAPSATYTELLGALRAAGITRRAVTCARNAAAPSTADSTTFALAVYPDGVGGPKRVRWFVADEPTRWDVARDRLAEAGELDPAANRSNSPGYWVLVTSPEAFNAEKSEPLPSRRGAACVATTAGSRRARNAARTGRYTRQGQTVFRDCEPILRLERVDDGDNLYAISAQEAEQLTGRFVRALNRGGR